MDFSYFKNDDYEIIERRIADREDLLEKELELREEYETMVERFIILFENIIRYNQDLNIFISEVEEDTFAENLGKFFNVIFRLLVDNGRFKAAFSRSLLLLWNYVVFM